jgi:hypothetical protein
MRPNRLRMRAPKVPPMPSSAMHSPTHCASSAHAKKANPSRRSRPSSKAYLYRKGEFTKDGAPAVRAVKHFGRLLTDVTHVLRNPLRKRSVQSHPMEAPSPTSPSRRKRPIHPQAMLSRRPCRKRSIPSPRVTKRVTSVASVASRRKDTSAKPQSPQTTSLRMQRSPSIHLLGPQDPRSHQ